MENQTAKHFVLQLGSLVSLYLTLAFLIVLLFGLINLVLPMATDNPWETNNAHDMVRLGIAMTIVFFPTYLVLTRLVNQARRKSKDGAYLILTKWLIYLSLLVGGGILLGDLVAVIIAYLNGEITVRFLLKAGVVLIAVGMTFFYYIRDARGFWTDNEKCSLRFGSLATALVVVSLLWGFLTVDSPSVIRERKLDETQVSDLSEIQIKVMNYLREENKLPDSIASAFGELAQPQAPSDRSPYRFELTDEGFKLCAEFAEASMVDSYYGYTMPLELSDYDSKIIVNPDDWEHGAGEWCFDRVVSDTGAGSPSTGWKPINEELSL